METESELSEGGLCVAEYRAREAIAMPGATPAFARQTRHCVLEGEVLDERCEIGHQEDLGDRLRYGWRLSRN